MDSDVGSVSYRLKATVERTAFVQNTVKKKNIRIQRCIIPSEYEMIQSLEIHNTWAQKMVYDISVPSKLYAFNDVIPISFKILPLANHLKVNAIMASIKEYCTYRAKNHTKTDTRICRLVRVDTPFSAAVTTDASAWTRVVDLQVPAKSPLIFSNTDNDMIRIRHKLKFVISLVNADGHYSELRCAVNIVVIESFAATEELTTLPAYDDMWRSVPYEPHVVETLRTRASISEQGTNELNPQVTSESRQPVTISGWSRLLSVSAAMNIPDSVEEESQHSTLPISIPGSNSGSRHHSRRPSFDLDLDPEQQQQQGEEQQQGNPEQQWWEGVDLGKVPSYTSMANFDLSLLSASLPPAYDTLLTFGNSPRSRF